MADRAKRLRATTLEGYESAIRKHIAPAWTGREVESITHEELQSWVDSIPTAGAADKAFKTFRQIYRWTIRKHQLRIWDVTQGVELPKRRMAKRGRMTASEERRMLREVMGEPYKAVVLAGAALGLRPSEAASLTGRTWTGGRAGCTCSAARTPSTAASRWSTGARRTSPTGGSSCRDGRSKGSGSCAGSAGPGACAATSHRSASTRALSACSSKSAGPEHLHGGSAALVGDHRDRVGRGARRRRRRARPHERGDVQAPLPAQHESCRRACGGRLFARPHGGVILIPICRAAADVPRHDSIEQLALHHRTGSADGDHGARSAGRRTSRCAAPATRP